MRVSIIVCTYSPSMFNHFAECVDSLINQTYPDLEIICIVDGNKEYYNIISMKLSNLIIKDNVKLHLNERNLGLTESRNIGVKLSSGDVIAFIDDDAVADLKWIQELVKMHSNGVVAAGGSLLPLWVAGKPKWLPEEFYWLIGVTYLGHAETVKEVRNTFGSNISFKKSIFLNVGGFASSKFGLKGKGLLQAGETELCMRIWKKYRRGVIYNPKAVVYHKIFSERLKFYYLVKRAFWQGYSKAIMENITEIGEEKAFLKYLLVNRTFSRTGNFFRGSGKDLLKLFFIWWLTFFVGCGYTCGKCFSFFNK